MRSRARRLLAVVLVLILAVIAIEPARVTVQTVVLLPNLLDLGVKPLTLVTPAPSRVSLPYRESARGDQADLWLPAGASIERRVGAMLLIFGVNNLGRRHPAVERVADGLARTGVAVLVPDSATLLEGRLEVSEIDGVVRAFQLLADRPEVDPARVGIVGFSVGGSLSLIAAADPRIAHRVRWINAFGAYADADTYLASMAAHAYELDGEEVAWLPSPLAREVFAGFALEQVTDDDDRRRLADAYQEPMRSGERPRPNADLAEQLGPDARHIYDLLTAESLTAARRAIERLPAATRRFMDGISPLSHLNGLRATVYLMHERDDHHVPFVESRLLAEPLRPRDMLVRHSEFRLFDHVQPGNVDLLAATPELWKLLWHVQDLMVETL